MVQITSIYFQSISFCVSVCPLFTRKIAIALAARWEQEEIENEKCKSTHTHRHRHTRSLSHSQSLNAKYSMILYRIASCLYFAHWYRPIHWHSINLNHWFYETSKWLKNITTIHRCHSHRHRHRHSTSSARLSSYSFQMNNTGKLAGGLAGWQKWLSFYLQYHRIAHHWYILSAC